MLKSSGFRESTYLWGVFLVDLCLEIVGFNPRFGKSGEVGNLSEKKGRI